MTALRHLPRPTRRRVAVAVVLLMVLAFRFGRSDELKEIPTPLVAAAGAMEVTLPEEVAAGDSFDISIDGAQADTPIEITFDAGYGLRTIVTDPPPSDAASVTVTVPPVEGPASGATIVSVTQGEQAVTAQLEIQPGTTTGPIDVYLGPRTVIADNNHFVMIVAVPTDAWGNPVAAETPVDFTTTRPDLSEEQNRYPTEDLVAWDLITSRTTAGRTRVATEVSEAGAPERSFLEVADLPGPYALELIDPLLPADGQALITVRTGLLADSFGNVLPDGTTAILDADGVTGIRRINGQTVDGRAEFTLEVPDQPGAVTLVATASGTESAPLELNFETAVRSLTAELERQDDVAIVHVGPVRSVRTSFVPEGTVALVTAADGTTATVDLSLGVGDALFVPETDLETFTVEVLGTEITVRADP